MKEVLGEWVPNDQVHPATNIWKRPWMTQDGEMSGVYLGLPIPEDARRRGVLWHFPPPKHSAG